jgi:hypothetical protein
MTTIGAYIKARRKKESASTVVAMAKLVEILKRAYSNFFER